MAEHTPGPWILELEYNPKGFQKILGGQWGTHNIAQVVKRQSMKDEDEANARLIAVAPELLQVAYLAVSMGWGGEHHPDCDDEGEEPVTGCICGLSQVLATIAKAEGRA